MLHYKLKSNRFTFETRSEIISLTVSSTKSSIFEWYCCCIWKEKEALACIWTHTFVISQKRCKADNPARSDLLKIIILNTRRTSPWKRSTQSRLPHILCWKFSHVHCWVKQLMGLLFRWIEFLFLFRRRNVKDTFCLLLYN